MQVKVININNETTSLDINIKSMRSAQVKEILFNDNMIMKELVMFIKSLVRIDVDDLIMNLYGVRGQFLIDWTMFWKSHTYGIEFNCFVVSPYLDDNQMKKLVKKFHELSAKKFIIDEKTLIAIYKSHNGVVPKYSASRKRLNKMYNYIIELCK